MFKVPTFRPALAYLVLLAGCAAEPPASRLSLHACTRSLGQPEYPDTCTQPVPEYYGVGDYGYYPVLLPPYYPVTAPVAVTPPTPPAKPPTPPAPRPMLKHEPVHPCPASRVHACPR